MGHLSDAVRLRTYARRKSDGTRESWSDIVDRTIDNGLALLGKFDKEDVDLLRDMLSERKAMPSGRYLWVGGTDHARKPVNYPSLYNCTSTIIDELRCFGLLYDLAMQGCGTGAILEVPVVAKLPPILRPIKNVYIVGEFGTLPSKDETEITIDTDVNMVVGDSRQGWVAAYQSMIDYCCGGVSSQEVRSFIVDIGRVRPAGRLLKGFGGVSNPGSLPGMFQEVRRLMNDGVGKPWTPLRACYLIDIAARVAVAGNIRRAAGIRQFSPEDAEAIGSKRGLWSEDAEGNWRIDPNWDALRMANHTVIFHERPSLETIKESVGAQWASGEGALMDAGMAVFRANRDLLPSESINRFRLAYESGQIKEFLREYGAPEEEIDHRASTYGLNPCGEIQGSNFFCNLSEIHLNQLNPHDNQGQYQAFRAGGLAVAALLHHKFEEPRYQKSREQDPIVGVSFTGLTDYFIHALGAEWLEWVVKTERHTDTSKGRQFREYEIECLSRWRQIARDTVYDYCDQWGLRRPNRVTTVQPAGTKSILTGASNGWHFDKDIRYIRRVTFVAWDPIALAAYDLGYRVIPSQNAKTPEGRLMDDPFDPGCPEWLVEFPIEKSWANIPGVEEFKLSEVSVAAQWDLYMLVQRFYTDHNTSATLEVREHEINQLSGLIHTAMTENQGYVSAAILARFDSHQSFPRLPFEPITAERYVEEIRGVNERRKYQDFEERLKYHDQINPIGLEGPAGCDSDKCLRM